MTDLFANKIALSSNNPSANCTLNNVYWANKNENKILIYPNPSANVIHLKVPSNRVGASYKVLDFTGRLILSDKIGAENIVINVNYLNNGIYVICVGDQNECTYFAVQSQLKNE